LTLVPGAQSPPMQQPVLQGTSVGAHVATHTPAAQPSEAEHV
jgi:hypothetical protein